MVSRLPRPHSSDPGPAVTSWHEQAIATGWTLGKWAEAEFAHRHVHLLHVTIVMDGGMHYKVECPQEHLDYRARYCSVGDFGCGLQAVVDDGSIDPLELIERGLPLENPAFPLAVTIDPFWGNTAQDVLDELTISLWEGRIDAEH